MEKINKKSLLIALVLAAFTTALILVYLKNSSATPIKEETMKVYVAAKALSPKHLVEASDLKEEKIPVKMLNSNALLEKSDIVGKRVKESILEGEQFLAERLVPEKNLEIDYNITHGKRAVSVNVTEQTEVGSHLKVGDYVDVVASFEEAQLEDKVAKYIYPAVTKTIIQNVKVLALGQEKAVADEKTKDPHKTITLETTPQDAEKLVFTSQFAVIRLTLRGVDDSSTYDSKGVIKSDMVDNRGMIIQQK